MALEGLLFDTIDLNTASGGWRLESFEAPPPAKRAEWAQGADVDGASLVRDPLFENRSISMRLRLAQQTSMDDALAAISSLSKKIEECEQQPEGLPLVWTPADSSTYITFYVLTGQISDVPVSMSGDDVGWFQRSPVVNVQLTCKPFGYGASSDIIDDFSVDTLADYTFDSGSGTVNITGGQIVPTDTTQKRMIHTARAPVTDAQVTMKMVVGTTISGDSGPILRRTSANTYLLAQVTPSGGMATYAVVGGSFNLLVLTGTTSTVSAGQSVWVRLRAVGNLVTSEYWTTDPTLGGTPTASTSATMTGSNATNLGAGISGYPGMRLFPGSTNWRFDDFHVQRYAGAGSGQLVSITLPDVPGDVPAEGRLIVSDTAGQNRRHVEWGLESRYYNAAALQVTPTITGFVGASSTRSGSVNTNVARGTLAATPLAIAGLGAQSHIGTYRVKARVYPSALDTYVRLAYSDGNGQLHRNTYVAPPVQNWVELDLGLVTINEAQLGSQTWTGQVEAYSTTNGTTLDVDYVLLIPAGEGYGRARSPDLFETPTNASAHDEFDQIAGALSGKALPLGGTWSGAGDADDFSVNATTHTLERTAVSDTDLQTGRYALAGSTNYTNISVQTDLTRGTVSGTSSGLVYQGVFARYTDANNWLMVVMSTAYIAGPSAYTVRLIKRVSGTTTTIATSTGTLYTGLRLIVDTNGRYAVWTNPTQPGSILLLQGSDTALATGGALATGKVGIYDADTTAIALTRSYDNFFAFVPAGNNALYSGRQMEFRHDGAIRQDSTGAYYSPAPTYRGSRFLIPPAGDADRTARVVVKAHRNNVEANDAANVTDSLAAWVTYIPRYLAVPG